ncbi:signal recognition particle-docking protein FtsY [Streptococcus australis]|uniref:Signal recognition particle receptor FtsY n=1 Tax=Streptococcus australis ATCC 700641 TaxID=888833 RepID=E7SBT2_9STRE|nr:signal recognition particle-docking protein FtsY [Streptococcus australis]EFV98883.1 signal recognition particle-docking protein FtsY [Streptococcus australis ATCC 700641]EGU62256.1 signal recognition particle-docking protein FtsY [Streptococcus australis ATCC 700641]SQH66807.1 signal recognition particle-docking protein FtsY [Streptococcus australis]
MGLFDRLFGRKKEETKPQAQELTEELVESPEEASSLVEPETSKASQSDEAKISAMEAYYAELKERMAAESARSAQESKAFIEESPTEEPVKQDTAVQEEAASQVEQDTSPEEVAEPASVTEDQTLELEASQEVSVNEEQLDSSSDLVQEALEEEVLVRPDIEAETSSPSKEPEEVVEEESEVVPELEVVKEAPILEEETLESLEAVTEELEAESPVEEPTSEPEISEEVEEEPVVEETTSEPEIAEPTETVQDKYNRSLKKTRTGFGAALNAFFANFRSVDEDFFEELEELLIMSDVGVQVASNLTEELRYEARLENAKKPDVLRRVIIEKLVDLYEKDGQYNEQINFKDGLTVMLFVGVNGVGKTTSIGKLAHKYKKEGKKVMLVAADTFRAGAVAQLAEWGRRVDVPVVTGPEKSDPASVVFDGMERAVAEQVDVLMIDTAGRLQNKDNLMAELEKIGRIIKRVDPTAPHETFLALDASTGQNALVQAKEFSKITPITGIVLTKIDGTARGGVVLAIREELDIPVKLIGFGEKIDDIGEFNSENFMRGLLEGLI